MPVSAAPPEPKNGRVNVRHHPHIGNLVVFPALLAFAHAAARGSMKAYLAWTGTLVYSGYTYTIYAFDVHFGPLFLLYVAVFGLSVWALGASIAGADPALVKERFATPPLVGFAANLLIVVSSGFALLWLSEDVPAIIDGSASDTLVEVGAAGDQPGARPRPQPVPPGLHARRPSPAARTSVRLLSGPGPPDRDGLGTGIVALMIVLDARGEDASLVLAAVIGGLVVVQPPPHGGSCKGLPRGPRWQRASATPRSPGGASPAPARPGSSNAQSAESGDAVTRPEQRSGGTVTAMGLLDSWTLSSHTANGVTHPTYRKGEGPGVIVIHEVPGITSAVIGFAEEVVERGFTVVLPSLFGRAEARATVPETLRSIAGICVSREFSLFALGRTTPVATWLRSVARELHAELGGPGVGAVGMCLTGGFALAMLADAPVAAPVLAQPASPAPVGKARRADLGLSPGDLESVKAKVAAGCQVLGLRYDRDPAVGTRFDTLRRELGDNFIAVELPGRQHSTLTENRQQDAVDRVLAFFEEKLTAAC
jgi:dienelactone hydrolase